MLKWMTNNIDKIFIHNLWIYIVDLFFNKIDITTLWHLLYAYILIVHITNQNNGDHNFW
jgi:uncharacterized membrane protein